MLPGERFERGDECYAVESHIGGGIVEVELVHYRRRRAGRWHHEWTRLETIVAHQFPERDMTGYWRYSSQVEVAARHALDGELGCYVDVRGAADGFVRIRLVSRRMCELDLVTEILEEHHFDASEPDAVTAGAERAEELRERARRMNDDAANAATASSVEADDEAIRLRERAREAAELARILRRDQAD